MKNVWHYKCIIISSYHPFPKWRLHQFRRPLWLVFLCEIRHYNSCDDEHSCLWRCTIMQSARRVLTFQGKIRNHGGSRFLWNVDGVLRYDRKQQSSIFLVSGLARYCYLVATTCKNQYYEVFQNCTVTTERSPMDGMDDSSWVVSLSAYCCTPIQPMCLLLVKVTTWLSLLTFTWSDCPRVLHVKVAYTSSTTATCLGMQKAIFITTASLAQMRTLRTQEWNKWYGNSMRVQDDGDAENVSTWDLFLWPQFSFINMLSMKHVFWLIVTSVCG